MEGEIQQELRDMARSGCRILSLGEGMKMTTDIDDVPDWVVEVIQTLAKEEDISLEQASRQLMIQGALLYTGKWDKMKKRGESRGA